MKRKIPEMLRLFIGLLCCVCGLLFLNIGMIEKMNMIAIVGGIMFAFGLFHACGFLPRS